MALLVPSPNNWLQARPGFAWLFVLAPRPGLPEPKRWATDSAQVPLLTLPERVDKDSTCQASCALGILRQGARSRTGATRTSHHKRVPKLRRLCRCVNSEDTCTLHLHEPKVRRRGRRCGWVVLGCVGFGILMGGGEGSANGFGCGAWSREEPRRFWRLVFCSRERLERARVLRYCYTAMKYLLSPPGERGLIRLLLASWGAVLSGCMSSPAESGWRWQQANPTWQSPTPADGRQQWGAPFWGP
jgi:hypothetical protein